MRDFWLAVLCLLGMASTAGAADILGPVPIAGPPLRVKKNVVTPQHLDLTWGDSCGPDQNDFAVYEGTIGNWYSHTHKVRTTGGAVGVTDLNPAAGSRYYLAVALSTASEGSYGTRSSGAERPVGASKCRATQSTAHCEWKSVFLSSATYAGNLGGLSGADSKCQALADAVGLKGIWKAFLSSSTTNASSRLTHSSLSYRRIDAALIASNDVTFFSNNHVNPIDVDEHGVGGYVSEVWTGSGGSGVGSGGCADWTSSGPGGSFPAVGLSNRSDSAWANAYLQFCDRGGTRLYCVEQ